jgi:ABC-type multidrug transport system ATPase subunit
MPVKKRGRRRSDDDASSASASGDYRQREVDRILTLLRLRKVADSQIVMCSGGERKRVNIGTELLTDPAVLLLDEPTSGLDSTSCLSLLRLLHTLADGEGKTVITSIHQPSSAVFRSFDRLLMLSEGTVVYFGTPVDSLDYLRAQDLACPDGYNAADHWTDLLVLSTDDDDDDDEEQGDGPDIEEPAAGSLRRRRGEQGRSMASPRLQLERAWDREAVAEAMDAQVEDARSAIGSTAHGSNTGDDNGDDAGAAAPAVVAAGSKYNTSWGNQCYILTHRALKNSRSAIFTPINLCKSLALGLVAGMLWFQTEYTEANVNDIRSYFFFTMTFWVFDAMFQSLTAFPAERDVILKERASGSYHLSAYFMAKTAADAPVRLTLPFLYMTVSFWMAGVDNQFSVFIGSIACTLLSVVAGEAMGLFIGAAVYDLQKGLTIMTVFTLFLMLLGGFFVENVPDFIAWAKYISPFKYAFDSSLQLVFDRPVPCDGSGALEELCAGSDTGYVSDEDVLDFIGVQGSIAFNAGILLVFCFVPRFGAYWALRMKKSGDRS